MPASAPPVSTSHSSQPSSPPAPYAFLNGAFLPLSEIGLPPSDRGFLLGDGVFDTMMAAGGRLSGPDAHMRRLRENADVLGIPFPAGLSAEKLLAAAAELLRLNGLAAQGEEGGPIPAGHASIRTTLTRGSGPRGLAPPASPVPMCLMTVSAFDPAPLARPLSAIIAAGVRRNEGSPLSRIKSLNYGDNIIARREAALTGADEAFLLNNGGYVCCGTNCNIFIEQDDGRLVTPPVADGVLAGIAREGIMSEYGATEKSLRAKDLLNARAVYVSNSLCGLRPVTRIGDKAFERGNLSAPA